MKTRQATDKQRETTAEAAARTTCSPLFKQYSRAFELSTGLPLDFVLADDLEAEPYAGRENENRFCAMMRQIAPASWRRVNRQLQAEARRKRIAITSMAFAGILETAVPVQAGKTLIGFLRTGQVLPSDPDTEIFDAFASGLRPEVPPTDMSILRAAYLGTPVVPLNRYHGVVHLLNVFAEQLDEQSNRLLLMQWGSEPECIVKAKQFIVEHAGGKVALEAVANHVGMSSYYFCKLFKSVTGITFTNFLGRLRVEKSKQLLLDPRIRISQVAYRSGFQSISQFNRCFLRFIGKSPSEFRAGDRKWSDEPKLMPFEMPSATATYQPLQEAV